MHLQENKPTDYKDDNEDAILLSMDPDGWRPVRDFGHKAKIAATLVGSIVLLTITVIGLPLRGSAPEVKTPPTGTIYFLSAVDASEHSTAVRSLFRYSAGENKPDEIYTETEPVPGNGVNLDPPPPREWMTLLTVSPDGASLGYVDTIYNIQEETHTQQSSVMVMPLRPFGAPLTVLPISKPMELCHQDRWDGRATARPWCCKTARVHSGHAA